MPPESLRILLTGLVDYAGLFPPAALSLADVVANYASYRQSPDAWMLGRLIVPVSRLEELSAALTASVESTPDEWRISALAGHDAEHDAALVIEWNASVAGAVVDTVEMRVTSPDAVDAAAHAFRDFTLFIEFPLADHQSLYLDAIASAGVRAKIRTGGVTADAFPPAEKIVDFLRGCADRSVAFKATAGLHHPLRDSYRLTYAPDAPQGVMYGFLNVFLAAAFAREGMPDHQLLALVQERDHASFHFSDDAVHWRNEAIDIQRLADTRSSFAIAFGSCSFREPIDDLHQLGML